MSEHPGLAEVNRQLEQLVLRLEEQGVLDGQFKQILQLPDESNPNFVTEVVELFLANAQTDLAAIGRHLSAEPPDFASVDRLLIRMKGSNDTFGARGLGNLCEEMRAACGGHDGHACAMILRRQHEAVRVLGAEMAAVLATEARKREMTSRQAGIPVRPIPGARPPPPPSSSS